MKKILYIFFAFLSVCFYMSCNSEDDYSLNRPNTPEELTATKGDTSVFLKWTPVENASYYLVVRGLKVIADSLKDNSYEDDTAPDTLTEYRVYAVNDMGWRSKGYAVDSGYLGIPSGIMPRAPKELQVSTDNVQGCVLTWKGARFATSYKIYKNDVFYKDVTDQTFTDYECSTADTKYSIYAVNNNGVSQTAKTGVGKKAYYFIDTFEKYETGSVIKPWTFAADRIGYYTEGSPKVVTDMVKNGSKSLLLKSAKVQLLDDWGGVLYAGYYEVGFWAYKQSGTFTLGPNFASWQDVSSNGKWVHFTARTGALSVGNTFNLTLQNNEEIPLYIDDISIEYIKQ